MANIDPALVSKYFDKVTPSIMGPYMMDGFGFPNRAGTFRFDAEKRMVDELLLGVDRKGLALDLGCGVGYWSEYFAESFDLVEAIEGSPNLYGELNARCGHLNNVRTFQANVLEHQPQQAVQCAFLGGLLMYLEDRDAQQLLKHLVNNMAEEGVVLCRESTVRHQTITKSGEYPVIYRTLNHYQEMFDACGYEIQKVSINEPYVLLQMGCEWMKKWKAVVPERFQYLPAVGGATYWGLRVGRKVIPSAVRLVNESCGSAFPYLQNHFFLLTRKTTNP